ncbi:TPA: sugar phosphate isomerase/epimerase [bacterium]|nr:sugar phosphate isomerase/epimerase [bacterium]
MQIGIMARTFSSPKLSEILDGVISHEIYSIQFSFGCVGFPELPEKIDLKLCDDIRAEVEKRKITMSAMSGTFNMIDPDINKRKEGIKRLSLLISACKNLGTSVITLCTGTRDPQNMWRRHPDNDTEEAFIDLVETLKELLDVAEKYNVILAFEPEVSNVIDSANRGKRLIDELKSPYLKVVMDCANIFHKGELAKMDDILKQAFELLGEHIIIAHAKDLDHDGDAGHLPAGKGLLDYDRYISLLKQYKPDAPLILHGLNENEVGECVNFLRKKIG